jgi:hypothetical protein
VFEDRVLRTIFGYKREEITEDLSSLHSEDRYNLRISPNTIKIIKSRGMRWEGNVTRIREMTNAYRILIGKLEGKRKLWRSRRRWEDNNNVDLMMCTRFFLFRTGSGSEIL